MLFVAKIHNNSLGSCFIVQTYDEGVKLIREMATEQLQRELDEDEISMLENDYEIYNDEDSDNVYSWSIGILEETPRDYRIQDAQPVEYNGGQIEPPDENGTIRRYDHDGNCEEIRTPDEDNWNEWYKLWF